MKPTISIRSIKNESWLSRAAITLKGMKRRIPVHADIRGIFQKISANNQAAQL
jgi:hypothetical protein